MEGGEAACGAPRPALQRRDARPRPASDMSPAGAGAGTAPGLGARVAIDASALSDEAAGFDAARVLLGGLLADAGIDAPVTGASGLRGLRRRRRAPPSAADSKPVELEGGTGEEPRPPLSSPVAPSPPRAPRPPSSRGARPHPTSRGSLGSARATRASLSPAASKEAITAAHRRRGLGSLAVLPPHILERVLSSLLPRSLTCVGCASPALRAVVHDEALWRQAALRRAHSGMAPPCTRYALDGSAPDVCVIPFDCSTLSWRVCMGVGKGAGLGAGGADELACQSKVPPASPELLLALPLVAQRRRLRSISLSALSVLPEDAREVLRLDSGTTSDKFARECDSLQAPAVLKGAANMWPLCGVEASQLCEAFPGAPLRTTEGGLCMTGECFGAYLKANGGPEALDAEPLCVCDPELGGAPIAPEIEAGYAVPNAIAGGCVGGDLMEVGNVLCGDRRPANRWLLAAPPRAGWRWHAGPALTCAWHALASGRQRWALYPPGQGPEGARAVSAAKDNESKAGTDDPSALEWFTRVYPSLVPHERPLECVLEAGDVIWLPAGWWHCALNIEETLAVRHSLVTEASLIAAQRQSVRYSSDESPVAGKASGTHHSESLCGLGGDAQAAWAAAVREHRPHLSGAMEALGL